MARFKTPRGGPDARISCVLQCVWIFSNGSVAGPGLDSVSQHIRHTRDRAMPAKHTIRAKRPSLPPILEIDEDGLPVSEVSFSEGRRWTGDDADPSVQLADWPTEFDD